MKRALRLQIFLVSFCLFFLQVKNVGQIETSGVEVTEGNIFSINDVMVTLEDSYIRIAGEDDVLFNEQVRGLKQVEFSKDREYMLILSYDFPEAEENFQIYGYLFDNNFELTDKFINEAFYGMPHPLYKVNNNGVITYIDPLTLKLTIRERGNEKVIDPEEGIEFEMERQIYIDSNDEGVAVIYNRELIPIEEENPVFTVVRYDFDEEKEVTGEAGITAGTYFGLTEGGIIISGVKFEESVPNPLSIMMNERLEKTGESREINFERLASYGGLMVGTFNKSLIVFNDKFEKKGERYITGEGRFKGVFEIKGELGIMVEEDGMLWIFRTDDNAAGYNEEEPRAVLGFNNFDRFVNAGECFIHRDNQTYIIK